MKFVDLLPGQAVFLDANIFIYYFRPNPVLAPPCQMQSLTRHRLAIDELALIGIQVLPVTGAQVSLAADLSCQWELLSSDALVLAVMRDHGLAFLASHDADFDRVPGITRYAPI